MDRRKAMNVKTKQAGTNTKKRTGPGNNQCITCLKPCSMSGLCMRPWPEFPAAAKKKAIEYLRGKKQI
jgi:hypothetical protein